ncbi:hypothetical protein [Haloechinothrix salitolerans]|uniref:AMP-binding enzyme C-terminal domain-containing protein n=1 Tax=Haloechinothrix salitolerans TaxID=926830 RepID=A0ABW2C754_9PSEU
MGRGAARRDHPRRGAELSTSDIVAHLERRLARYKIPKSFITLDEIPRNASGKVRKDQLRQHYAH